MTEPTFLERNFGQPLVDFVQLGPDSRAHAAKSAVADLNFFFDEGRGFEDLDLPPATRDLAKSLFEALGPTTGQDGKSLRERIVTDALLRGEADRDQNVYLGKLFTRTLTRAVPDLVFQPVTALEATMALQWARGRGVLVTLRGAASTAMGGAVPQDGGLTLDLSRLDSIEIDAAGGVCVVGAGARLRTIHHKLAQHGLALTVYPSNLGGTLTGWFATGGIGMNAFGGGRALDSVRAADVILPAGERVRFHDDGRLDVVEGHSHRTLPRPEVGKWFRSRGYEPFGLGDLAGSEGVFGILLHLTVRVEPRPDIFPFLLVFDRAADAADAAVWVAKQALPARPANVKFLSGSHLEHVRRVWQDEDARAWHKRPGALSTEEQLPWRHIHRPTELGVAVRVPGPAAAYLFVDFFELSAARAFAALIAGCPGRPRVLDQQTVRFAAERFKPQQIKRLGPGMLAAEIVMPAAEIERFLPRATALAHNVGNELDAEVYYLADRTALVIGGYLTDHRSGAFAVDLMIAPALLDLAMRHHRGQPYVLGRWQAAFADGKFGAAGTLRLRAIKQSLDPAAIVNRGVLLDFVLHGALGSFVTRTFRPMVELLRMTYGSPILAGVVRGARAVLRNFPGPARGRGAPLAGAAVPHGAPAGAPPPLPFVAPGALPRAAFVAAPLEPSARALHCVNCGECNTVCPIFNDSKIRLPQMLTHLGEAMHGGETLSKSASTLLDLCMRCGNCEQVCQAGIPHLPLYEELQQASDRARPRDLERHTAIVASVRGSNRYLREFLQIRPGGYLKRTPVALPGVARFIVLRSENDAGPAATCIHCGACVAVCPTHANREFEHADPRRITTLQERCIGCGSCVEVCPNNHQNGGQTLRVMEAPTVDWFAALDVFESTERK